MYEQKVIAAATERLSQRLAAAGMVSDRSLWAVLTALRGPDDPGAEALKGKYTIPIRRWFAELDNSEPVCVVGWHPNEKAPTTAEGWRVLAAQALDEKPFSHFVQHCYDALNVIVAVETTREGR